MTGITHKAGELVGFSDGEWSNYAFNGLYKILKDCDLATLLEEYTGASANYDGEGFGHWLSMNGYAEELNYDEIHFGHGDYYSDKDAKDVLMERLELRREIMAKTLLTDDDLEELYYHKV